MKRIGNLFEKVVTLENIELAHNKAKKDKLFYNEVKLVDKNPHYYFIQIQDMLINKAYSIAPSDYTMFEKIDKGKVREIYKLDYFPHRIIQHCLLNITQDIFLKTFIANTFASIPNRGIHLALSRLSKDIKNNRDETQYCLKMDIKKFYPSVDQEIAMKLLRSKFKDKDILWLFDIVISSMDKGIAIGSLASQWIGNFVLTPFDHWLKEEKGIKFYYRYADDMVILQRDKEFLHQLKNEIERYLSTKLNLKLKENWQVYPTYTRGVDFVGYRHFGDYILLRKTTSKNMIRKLRKISKKCQRGHEMTYSEWSSVNSYKGWVKWCNGHNLYLKHIKELEAYTNKYYTKEIKNSKSEMNFN